MVWAYTPVEINATIDAVVTNNYDNSDKFYSPLVKSIAEKEGISLSELDGLTGSGQGGRVTKKDILDYIETRGSQPKAASTAGVVTIQDTPKVAPTMPASENGSNFLSSIKAPIAV